MKRFFLYLVLFIGLLGLVYYNFSYLLDDYREGWTKEEISEDGAVVKKNWSGIQSGGVGYSESRVQKVYTRTLHTVLYNCPNIGVNLKISTADPNHNDKTCEFIGPASFVFEGEKFTTIDNVVEISEEAMKRGSNYVYLVGDHVQSTLKTSGWGIGMGQNATTSEFAQEVSNAKQRKHLSDDH